MGVLGFEPRTSALSELRSSQLSYTPGLQKKELLPKAAGQSSPKPCFMSRNRFVCGQRLSVDCEANDSRTSSGVNRVGQNVLRNERVTCGKEWQCNGIRVCDGLCFFRFGQFGDVISGVGSRWYCPQWEPHPPNTGHFPGNRHEALVSSSVGPDTAWTHANDWQTSSRLGIGINPPCTRREK